MVGKDNLKTEDLNLCFENLMMVAGGGNGGNMKVGMITEWKDIPVELLMQILSLVDDKTVIRASGVCRGWRDSIYFGLARLSLSCFVGMLFSV
ncbi:F-box protein skp2a-like [Trifolium pratense]|uniref:F-box protein skp2a-like n=1 Tax=Trifolium pratense TaxID=57577 RepID=A0A2K3M0W4_TRIPR|nr:F-box protein skp2a-like [Trifolium pratense]